MRTRKILCGVALGGLLAGVLPAASAWAADGGALDPTFGTAGKVLTDFEGGTDRADAVAVQPDGKIVVAGYSSPMGGDAVFSVIRYRADGSLDTTFGVGGRASIPLGFYASASAVAIQPDGKIVVAGYSDAGTVFYEYFTLVRFTANGAPDKSFGIGGKVLTLFDDVIVTTHDNAQAVIIQPDGKIVAGGWTYGGFALARYNTNGILDLRFGIAGRVVTKVTGLGGIYGLALQPDGKIVAAGSGNRGDNEDVALARYNSNGRLDATFGTGGTVLADLGGGTSGWDEEFASAVVLQRDGRIVIAGQSNPGDGDNFAVARFNTNGSLDAGFGTGGKVVTDVSGTGGIDEARAVALQGDGRIVAVGVAKTGGATTYDFALARYDTNGSLDATFGTGGTLLTDFGGRAGDTYDSGRSATIQPDGKIVAAGDSEAGGDISDIALARYLP